MLSPEGETVAKIEYDNEPFGEALQDIQRQIDATELLVLFNAKRDLHWLRRYGIRFQHKRIWDVQLAHFIMLGQTEPYPSLNGVAAYYNLGQKLDVVQEEYFSKKLDTDEVPLDTLTTYLVQDLVLTRDGYHAQLAVLADKPAMLRLIRLACIDLLILEEMEWNGIVLDVETCKAKAEQIRTQIQEMDRKLSLLVPEYPINWNSGDQLSIVLYGGNLVYTTRVADGTYKTGKKAGQVKFKSVEESIRFPRLVEPLERTELAKDGFYATSEPVLRSLRAKGKAREIINVLLDRAKLEKMVSGYYEGLPKQIAVMGWSDNTIHGTLNQCVAATGRLSSSKPNLQNNPKEVDKLFRSRYD